VKKVCFFGNSHLGAIREAVMSEAGRPLCDDLEITFFGSHGHSLQNVVVEGGQVKPTNDIVRENFEWTSGGQKAVTLGAFDVIYLIVADNMYALDRFFPVASNSLEFSCPPVPECLFDAILAGEMAHWQMALVRSIAAQVPEVPVYHLGAPLRSDAMPYARMVLGALSDLEARGADPVADLRARLGAYVARQETGNLRFLKPPAWTLEQRGLYTQQAYSIGSQRMSQQPQTHEANDYQHMNADYGVQVLRMLFAKEDAVQTESTSVRA